MQFINNLIPGADAPALHGTDDESSVSGITYFMEHWKNKSLENISEVVDGVLYTEEWRDIPGYERKYQVSNFGRIKTPNRQNRGYPGIIYQAINSSNGRYLLAQIYKNNKYHTFSVRRLVAICFIPNPNNLPEVNHMFGDKLDNIWLHPEWCTREENIRHTSNVLDVNGGLKHFRSKFSKQDVIDIFNSPGTHREIAKKYNVSHGIIGFIKRKQSYKTILNGLTK